MEKNDYRLKKAFDKSDDTIPAHMTFMHA